MSPFDRALRLLPFVVLAIGLPIRGQEVPEGFKTFDHKDTGLRFYYPGKFEATPTPPTERLILATFARSTPLNARPNDRSRHNESFMIFRLEARTTSQAGAAPVNEKPTSYEELVDKQNDFHEWKDFVQKRFPTWTIVTDKAVVNDEENSREYPLEYKNGGGAGDNRIEGYLYVRETAGVTYGILGHADQVVAEKIFKDYRRVGRSVHRPKGFAKVKDDSESTYKGRESLLKDIPFRVQARRDMIKGWKAHDTENFFLLYNTKNDSLVRQIAADLEIVRPFYAQFFPPAKPIEAVSVVRVFEDRAEYLKYGAPPMSAGYWNFVAKELVFYDASKKLETEDWKKKARPIDDTFIVLYHEAFHQYIYYAAGRVAPHDWFNEGLGDFFSGIEVFKDSRKIKGVGLNRWRLPVVKKMVDEPGFVPLGKLLNADRQMYYNPQLAGLMYAEGWSIVYFLTKSEEAAKNPLWQKIIPDYYETLKFAQKECVDALSENATLEQKAAGEETARQRAIKDALEDVNIEELEKAWKDWIRKVKDPWAAERQR